MATTVLHTPDAANDANTTGEARVLVCLPDLPADAQAIAVQHLASGFGERPLQIAGIAQERRAPGIEPIEYASQRSSLGWVLAASDYSAAASLIAHHDTADAILLLGSDAASLPATTLRGLVDSVLAGADLAVPRYPVGVHDALVTSAVLYPLTRTLFNADIRFPLPVDAAVSMRMLQRLAAGHRTPTAQNTDSLVWPVAEAAAAGFRTLQVDSTERHLPSPPNMDLKTLLGSIFGSLFADIEAKAPFWQRARNVPAHVAAGAPPDDGSCPAGDLDEVNAMLENFRLASANLGEIWSLVLPPQSLLALKKLASMPAEQFCFDPGLWARTVYDFALAFHGRSLNRGHLLGAMTPLYLAWVASHIRTAQNDLALSERLIEVGVRAFEREKPYFVARWRWPDRFNP